MWAIIDENMCTLCKSQMERKNMFRLFFYIFVILGAVISDAKSAMTNQVLMYNMLNNSPQYEETPTDIRHQRYWQRMKKLQWLANPRNLLKPGLDENYEEDFTG